MGGISIKPQLGAAQMWTVPWGQGLGSLQHLCLSCTFSPKLLAAGDKERIPDPISCFLAGMWGSRKGAAVPSAGGRSSVGAGRAGVAGLPPAQPPAEVIYGKGGISMPHRALPCLPSLLIAVGFAPGAEEPLNVWF